MATQRVIHEEIAANQPINITYTNNAFQPNPKACIIQGGGQQGVTFTNTSGTPVAINFVPNPVNPGQKVFNDIPNLGVVGVAQMPQVSNGSVNFNITAGGQTYGPFAIQVGSGPLQVLVSMNNNIVSVTPPIFMVPIYSSVLGIAGTLAMCADNVNNNYSIGWLANDPFTPPITAPDCQPHSDSSTTVSGDYGFTVSAPSPVLGGNGGGTVKIKGA